MKRYTVKQLADLSHSSVRTLHYYHEIGLLAPAYTGENGYRYYGPGELLRLQQILLYREIRMPLEDIKLVLDRPNFDVADALRSHKQRLESELARFSQLIGVIDKTLAQIDGDSRMQDHELYKWHSPEKQAQYEAWLTERYGEQIREHIDFSTRNLEPLNEKMRDDILIELERIERDLAGAFRAGVKPGADALRPVLARHQGWVARMWGRTCTPQAYAGLADMYNSHPDFISRYDKLEAGFANYMADTIRAYVSRANT